ncbi:hypothetical protein CAI21_09470 [Alkalilimnicola ehrlichii]|uniref:Uncharacterized protein n=1 Tax=Alkalilimnicola ehrlichii TaxID=351052 RepID=A0A3E0WUZ9_9GAMM|nr:hypothetical protein [Alkalilimnicola ehrlichii]RFA29299.1 hypothetical protein CAI21_09470 [Alkalilimnicola ehrlichii]RFA36812.1 hypothetical protein CAL65_09805 [Alkalilimnicola ehrlichii]
MKDVLEATFRAELADKHGSKVELYSREVILGARYMGFRNLSGRVLGAEEPMSLGEYLVHNLLGPEERKSVFTSPYDLGNRAALDSDAARQQALSRYLGGLTASVDNVPRRTISNVEDVLKKLKHIVRDLTGYDYKAYTEGCIGCADAHESASYAVKALCTLFRYRLEWPKAFSQFNPPSPKKANLELRDAHPLRWHDDTPEKGVSIYADLKLSLTHGMDAEDVETLVPILKRIAGRYAESSFVVPTLLALRVDNPHLKGMLPSLKEIERALPLGERVLPERLDKSLYVGLVMREIEHRVAGKQYINEFLAGDKAAVPRVGNSAYEALSNVLVAQAKEDEGGFRAAIRRLTGHDFSDEEFTRASALSECLRWFVKSPLEHDLRYNRLELLAALIACLGRAAERITIKAYWYRKETSSNRPVYYLERVQGFKDLAGIPEFYQEYWFRRYALVLSRLVLSEDLWHENNQFEQFECARIIRLFQTHSFRDAAALVNAYLKASRSPPSVGGPPGA